MNQFKSFAALKEAVITARGNAGAEARRDYPWVWSRGTWFCTRNKRERCSPCEDSGCYFWHGTKARIEGLITEVLLKYPEVEEIWLEGGYDGGNTMSDRDSGDYVPWVSEWEVLVWKRETAPLPVVCLHCAEHSITTPATTASAAGHPVCKGCADYEREQNDLWKKREQHNMTDPTNWDVEEKP